MTLLLLSDVAGLALLAFLLIGVQLLIYGIARMRLLALESKVAALQQATQRVESVASKSQDDSGTKDLTVEVKALQPALDRIEAAVSGLGQDLARANARIEDLSGELSRRRSERLADRIHARFRDRGFQNVRVLGDLAAVEGSDQAMRIAIEGMKGGHVQKGFVVVRGGEIVEEKLSSSHEVFP